MGESSLRPLVTQCIKSAVQFIFLRYFINVSLSMLGLALHSKYHSCYMISTLNFCYSYFYAKQKRYITSLIRFISIKYYCIYLKSYRISFILFLMQGYRRQVCVVRFHLLTCF